MTLSEYYIKKSCRLCDSQDLALVLPLQKSPLCDEYLISMRKQPFYDLNLFYCKDCGHVQIDTVIDPETIYKDYIYTTTTSTGLVEHFGNYAKSVSEKLSLSDNDLVVDIGSNEGTLLHFFQTHGCKVLGIEPSTKAVALANKNGVETLCDFFDAQQAKDVIAKYGYAKLVTVNNLFANIDELYSFTKAINLLLDEEGVLVIESSYLVDMIDNMVFDFIYHEHLSYFAILPLVQFFERINMHLVHVEHVDTKGGSLRYYWSKKTSHIRVDESVTQMIQKEKAVCINEDTFRVYNANINEQKEKLLNLLEANKDKEIVAFGASATSTTIITHFELHKYLSYLVDENEAKVGTLSPGHHIPVHNIEKLNEAKEKIVLILAWRYEKDIVPKIMRKFNKIVVPLPYFKEILV